MYCGRLPVFSRLQPCVFHPQRADRLVSAHAKKKKKVRMCILLNHRAVSTVRYAWLAASSDLLVYSQAAAFRMRSAIVRNAQNACCRHILPGRCRLLLCRCQNLLCTSGRAAASRKVHSAEVTAQEERQ
jgi:hypothetical protein